MRSYQCVVWGSDDDSVREMDLSQWTDIPFLIKSDAPTWVNRTRWMMRSSGGLIRHISQVASWLMPQTPQNLWLGPSRRLDLKKSWMDDWMVLLTGTLSIETCSSVQEYEKEWQRRKSRTKDGARTRDNRMIGLANMRNSGRMRRRRWGGCKRWRPTSASVVSGFIRGPILATSGGCGTAWKLLDLSALANHIAKDAFIAVRPRSLTVSRANLFEKPKDLKHDKTLGGRYHIRTVQRNLWNSSRMCSWKDLCWEEVR